MRTVVVRLTDPVMGDGDLHGVVEVVGGATSTFAGAADLLRQLRAAVEAPADGARTAPPAPAERDVIRPT